MLIRKPQEIAPQTMTMPGAEGVRMRLMVGREDGAPNFAMRLFEVQPGGHTPLHQHNYEHEILILDGRGEVMDGEAGVARPINAGDVLFIPANQTHQFRNSAEQPLKFMCLVPTQFDCGCDGMRPTPGS